MALGAVHLEAFLRADRSQGARIMEVHAIESPPPDAISTHTTRGVFPMKVVPYDQIKATPVDMPGATGCKIRCLIDDSDGAPTFAMRHFEVAPGGHTPLHSHPHEHEVYALQGNGIVMEGEREHLLKPGTAVFVPGGVEHQFKNTGSTTLKFLCLIPHLTGDTTGSCAASCGCQ